MEAINTVHIIGSKGLGGAERFFYRLTTGLLHEGITVTALVRSGSEVSEHTPKGLPKVELPMRTVWDPVSKFFIKRAIKAIAPHVVQTYMGRATRLTRLKVGAFPVHVSRLGGYYKLDGYRHAHAWVGNTKGICDYLIRNGFPKKKVFHIPNFIEPRVTKAPKVAKEASRRDLRLPEDAWVLLSAGRFIPVKGHRYLLEAFLKMPDGIGGRPICLVLLGDGPLRGEYEKIIGQGALSPKKRLIMPGWVNDPIPYFIASDLVIFPSLETETLGNVVLEAWATMRPVIVTEFRGALEITRHKIDAYQVPCEDSGALERAMTELLRDSSLREEMAVAGYERVIGEFSRKRIVGQYVELYRELIRGVHSKWV